MVGQSGFDDGYSGLGHSVRESLLCPPFKLRLAVLYG